AAILFTVLALPAAAQQVRDTHLERNGAWDVFYAEDGSLAWCSAETDNNNFQTFTVAGFSTGDGGLFIFDDRWNFHERDVAFILDIDGLRWDITGTASGDNLSLIFNDVDDTLQFLQDLAGGSSVTVRDTDFSTVGSFSLAGSRASLSSMIDCWSSIVPASF
ncbi:MAG: hypothetical protein AAF914_04810, partial [Pseudomonadota bacterium]